MFLLVQIVKSTKVNYNTKMLLAPQIDIRYREVTVIPVRYKEVFPWDYDAIPPVLMNSVL